MRAGGCLLQYILGYPAGKMRLNKLKGTVSRDQVGVYIQYSYIRGLLKEQTPLTLRATSVTAASKGTNTLNTQSHISHSSSI